MGPIINQILGVRVIMVLMEMVEVMLVLGLPTSPPQMIILAEMGMMGGFINLSVSA